MAHFTRSIVSGALPTGAMLPREIDLAEKFTVSRGVARETVRALEERGLITVRHGIGATVSPKEDWDVFAPEVLTAILAGPESAQVLGDYLECRRILEVEAAGMAAGRATPADIARIEGAMNRMARTAAEPGVADPDQAELVFHEADLAFHHAVFLAAGNTALAALVRRLHSALLLARLPLARPEYRIARALPEHLAILAAIQALDPDAAREAMRVHLATVAQYLGEHAESEAI
jgi:GntR family transcriptional repressor for pyruvate dehydrogenase complex